MNFTFSLRQAFNAGVAAYGGAYALKDAYAHNTEAMLIDVGISVANAVLAGISWEKSTPSPR